MPAQIIDGTHIANQLKARLKEEIIQLKSKGIVPGLAVVLIGENPASKIYVHRKAVSCEEVGMFGMQIRLPETVSQKEVLETLSQLNNDSRIHGIIVQLPLPSHLNESKIMQSISPEKDVDGFHWLNQGKLYSGQASLVPNTPRGVIQLIQSTGISIAGKHAVVIGRSLTVGKPVAMLLLKEQATVTMCHSLTRDLAVHTQQADILVVAAGKARMLKKEMVKPHAIVIDVGISRNEDNKIVGDVDFEGVKEVAGYITPVPGGVGPMTVACLLENTITACKAQTQITSSIAHSNPIQPISSIPQPLPPICIGVLGSTKGSDMQAIIDSIESKTLNAKIGLVVADNPAYILERAKKHSIPHLLIDPKSFPTKAAFNSAIAQKMKAAGVELILLIGYKRIVTKELIEAFPHSVLNIHPSLLPAFPGKFDGDVHQEVLDAGVKLSGATLHIVTEDVDNGPIFSQEAVAIENNETSDSLKGKVQKLEQNMLMEAIRAYAAKKVSVRGKKVVIE